MLYLCYLCRFKPLRDHLRGFLIAAWAGDKIAEFSFPEISFHFPLRPWFFFVSPAYAGKSMMSLVFPLHPRGSPPRMRGKAKYSKLMLIPHRITPAYAGKSNQFAVNGADIKDHPRVCGEKKKEVRTMLLQKGSPPRMRGKGNVFRVFADIGGITPAYAGKRLKRSRSTVSPVAIVPLFPSVCNKPVVSDGSPAGRDAPLFLPAENAVPASPAYNLRSL